MIDFLKYRFICLAVTVLFFVSGAGMYVYNKAQFGTGFSYHIDFTGGTELSVSFADPINIDDVRKAAPKGYVPQSIGSAVKPGFFREFILRTGESLDENQDLAADFTKHMSQGIVDNTMKLDGISSVGSEVGRDIQWNSMVAVLLSLLFILLYIAFRSQSRFAVGAVMALAHDMLAVLVVFLIFREQVSVHVLAAVLAILGYSLNDTIVIFSRIRENMKKNNHLSEYEIINLSINQTLRRTILTSISTLLTVLSIFFLGGEVLHGFSLAMLVGVIAGTYSSVYVASPVMLAMGSSKK